MTRDNRQNGYLFLDVKKVLNNEGPNDCDSCFRQLCLMSLSLNIPCSFFFFQSKFVLLLELECWKKNLHLSMKHHVCFAKLDKCTRIVVQLWLYIIGI